MMELPGTGMIVYIHCQATCYSAVGVRVCVAKKMVVRNKYCEKITLGERNKNYRRNLDQLHFTLWKYVKTLA